ncbi:MAG: hypothetical protein FWG65_11790 [Turicibacter sp.]|nr:hypothetical protein [Turicibacter sp.]
MKAKGGEMVSQSGQVDKINYSDRFTYRNAWILSSKMQLISNKLSDGSYMSEIKKDIKKGNIPNMTNKEYKSLRWRERTAFKELEKAKRYVRDTQKILTDPKLQQDLGFTFESSYKP